MASIAVALPIMGARMDSYGPGGGVADDVDRSGVLLVLIFLVCSFTCAAAAATGAWRWRRALSASVGSGVDARKLSMGLIGGGPGSFIGRIHRIAAAMDAEIELVCGALSSDPQKSRLAGAALYLDPRRVYGSYEQMIEAESRLPVRAADGLRRDRDAQRHALRSRARWRWSTAFM